MNAVTQKDVLTFALAGCNAAEVAAYTGTSEEVAQARLDRALAQYAHPIPRHFAQLQEGR